MSFQFSLESLGKNHPPLSSITDDSTPERVQSIDCPLFALVPPPFPPIHLPIVVGWGQSALEEDRAEARLSRSKVPTNDTEVFLQCSKRRKMESTIRAF